MGIGDLLMHACAKTQMNMQAYLFICIWELWLLARAGFSV